MLRPFLAVAAALAFSAVPTVSVMACSCMEMPFDQAVADADLAIVGTLVAADAPAPGEPMSPIAMEWAIERSRDPIEVDRATIVGWPNDGANCGVSFEVGERWLVLAYAGEGGLETNGCMMNRRLDPGDPEAEALAEELLPVAAPTGPTESAGIDVPMPIILGGAAIALIVALSIVAFRGRAPGEGA